MADFGSPAQANYQAPNGLETLGNLMALKRAKQGLQSQQLQIQGQQQGLAGQAAEVQMAQQSATQRSALANIDWDKHLDSNGLLDTGSFAKDPEIRKAAGDQYPDILAKANQVRQGQIENQKSLLSLNQDQVGALGSLVGGLKTDPDVQADNPAGRQKVTNAFTQYGQVYGPQAAQVASKFAPMVQHAPPGKLPGAIQALQLQTESAGKQIEATTPNAQSVQGKHGLNFVNTNPNAAPPVGAPVGQSVTDQGIAPTVVKFPNDALGVIGGGSGGPASPKSSPTSQDVPQSRGLQALKPPGRNDPGYVQSQYIKTNEESRAHVQGALADFADPQNGPMATRYRNNELMRLLPHANTGPGKQMLNDIASGMPGPAGDDFQKVGHYLAQNTAANLSKMGVPNTNEGAGISGMATGNLSQNPGALEEITKVNDAVNSARFKYEQGLAKLTNNGADLSKVPAYKAAFGQNFDINLFRLEDAKRRGNASEIKTIMQKLGPEGLKALGAKKRVLDSLATTGDLPQ